RARSGNNSCLRNGFVHFGGSVAEPEQLASLADFGFGGKIRYDQKRNTYCSFAGNLAKVSRQVRNPNSRNALMAPFHRRAERFYVKLLSGAIIGIILVIALFWGGHDLYIRWQEKRLVRRAVYAIEHGDDAGASLAARTVLGWK